MSVSGMSPVLVSEQSAWGELVELRLAGATEAARTTLAATEAIARKRFMSHRVRRAR
jgi:hypothetical protein